MRRGQSVRRMRPNTRMRGFELPDDPKYIAFAKDPTADAGDLQAMINWAFDWLDETDPTGHYATHADRILRACMVNPQLSIQRLAATFDRLIAGAAKRFGPYLILLADNPGLMMAGLEVPASVWKEGAFAFHLWGELWNDFYQCFNPAQRREFDAWREPWRQRNAPIGTINTAMSLMIMVVYVDRFLQGQRAPQLDPTLRTLCEGSLSSEQLRILDTIRPR